jgi:hypothetical protein
MGDQSFAAREFRCIESEVRKGEYRGYNLELILRIVNFKSQAVLQPGKWETWPSVVNAVNQVLEKADKQDDECVVLERLLELEIPGIGVPRASALLAAWDPERFAIIDAKMFKFFRGKEDRTDDTYAAVKEIFRELDCNDEELRSALKAVKKAFEETAAEGWEDIYQRVYPAYLRVLKVIQQGLTPRPDLRAVELEIWSKSGKSHSDN